MSRKRKTSHTSGLYRTRVTVGRDADGEPIRKALYARTAEELESKAAKLRAARGLGVAVTDGKSSWQYWAQLWLNLKRPDVGKSQATNCATAVKHLAPLNEIKMSEVRPMHVRRIVQQMYESGYGKRTVQLIISVAGQIGKLAKKNNACAVNVIEDVRAPKDAPVTERKPISAEEEKLLWNVKPIPPKTKSDAERAARLPEARMFALIQLCCGLRREEAAALKWDNVNLRAGTVTVDSAVDFKGGAIKKPKSNAGFRTVPVPDKLLPALREWKKHQWASRALQDRLWVFPGRHGYLTEAEFARMWGILLDAINGIDIGQRIAFGKQRAKNLGIVSTGARLHMPRRYEFTSHQLRHTFASNALAAGIDVKTLQVMLGHSTPIMSLRYAHALNGSMELARQKLNEYDSFKESNGVNSVQKGQ